MSASMLYAIRKMGTDDVFSISLKDMSYDNVENNRANIASIHSAVRGASESFYELYEESASRYCYTPEAVFHTIVMCNFRGVARMKGIDVEYMDKTIHLRIVVDGIDERTEHETSIERSSNIASCDGGTVVVKYDKFRTTPTDEWWEYYIAM